MDEANGGLEASANCANKICVSSSCVAAAAAASSAAFHLTGRRSGAFMARAHCLSGARKAELCFHGGCEQSESHNFTPINLRGRNELGPARRRRHLSAICAPESSSSAAARSIRQPCERNFSHSLSRLHSQVGGGGRARDKQFKSIKSAQRRASGLLLAARAQKQRRAKRHNRKRRRAT